MTRLKHLLRQLFHRRADAPLNHPIAPAIEYIIREGLRQRRLPRDAAQLVSVGPGNGVACAGCGQGIPDAEQQWECEVGGRTLQFHQVCYMVWDEERDWTGL